MEKRLETEWPPPKDRKREHCVTATRHKPTENVCNNGIICLCIFLSCVHTQTHTERSHSMSLFIQHFIIRAKKDKAKRDGLRHHQSERKKMKHQIHRMANINVKHVHFTKADAIR